MTCIYLDSNVFDGLRKNDEPVFQKLNELLSTYRHNLSFCFSPAHIRDKRKDGTDEKFKDFEFMESLVSNNHISYHALNKNTSFYLATPLMVFEDDITDPQSVREYISQLFNSQYNNDGDIATRPTSVQELFASIKLPLSRAGIEGLDTEQQGLIDRLLPEGNEVSLLEWISHFSTFTDDMFANTKSYQQLRKAIDEGINQGHIKLTSEGIDLSQAFMSSQLNKTFVDFVKDSLHHQDKSQIPCYDFYMQAYNILDILAVSPDKLKKKNGFNNIFNDSLHSYYARYCDYLVTRDDGLIKKSKALYPLTDSATTVLTVGEFAELMPQIATNTESSIIEFFEHFGRDLRACSRRSYSDDGTSIWALEGCNKYLNTFEQILEVKNDAGKTYFFTTSPGHYLSTPNFHEESMVVEKCLSLFGADYYGFGAFDFDLDIKSRKLNEWRGRAWKIGPLNIHLQTMDSLNGVYLAISPIPN